MVSQGKSRLQAFTLYLDPEDPEDIPMIRYLRSKTGRKKAASELRAAMLLYMEYLKGDNLTPISRPVLAHSSNGNSWPEPQAQAALPPPDENGGLDTIRAAKRAFMRK
jgi:hypothetical protein